MKTATFRLLLGAAAGVWFGAGVALGACGGNSEVAGEWIFEPEAEAPGWAINSGGDGDMGNLGLTGGAEFSTNVPPVNCDCGHSLGLAGTNGAAGAVSLGGYDPLAEAEKFTVMAWVRRESAAGENLSARIFSDADSTSLADTTAGVEFRFSGSAGNLALRINGTEVATTVGGVAPESGEWHHVAAVYDGTRAATNYATRNVHFYVDGVQKGVGSVLQGVVVASNDAPVVVGNASAARTAGNLLVGNVDDVLVIPGWAPEPAGNGNASEAIQCFMAWADDIFPPGIAAPGDVEAEAGECLEPVAVELGTPTVWDDCQVVSVTNDAPTLFPLGTNVVTWTVRDEAGNVATCTQTVTVVPSRTGDCDGDGLTDWQEVVVYGTDWACADTDGDGLDDGEEAELETSPLLPDSDGDGWTDGEEVLAETDPLDFLSAPRVARGVLLHAVKYSAAGDSQWVQLHCSGPREVDLSGFRLQVAGTNWETRLTFPEGTWMVPGHFLLVGGADVTNADIEADLVLPGSYANLPTAGVRLMAPENSTNAPVDVLMYGTHVPFNEQALDTTGWLSETTNLWASSTRHLERWSLGQDTDREGNWRHVADAADPENAGTVVDTDGDGLTDEQEYTGSRNGGAPTDPLKWDSDGDGLRDGFEVRNGLDPLSTHSGGSDTRDDDTLNPSSGNTYGEDHLASSLEVTWTASKTDWTMGSSIGSNGWVRFDIVPSDGDAVWVTIVEGGHTPEDFTYSVSNATILYSYAKSVGGFTRLCLLLQPGQNRGVCSVEIQDDSAGSGVTDPGQIGPDIASVFQAARLDISMPHTDETTEEIPGEFIPDATVHADAPRTALTIAACELDGLPGKLRLAWDDEKVAVYSSPQGGEPLADCEMPACAAGPATLYVEGLDADCSELSWKSTAAPELNDAIGITGARAQLVPSKLVALDGESIDIDVRVEPASAQPFLSDVHLSIGKPDGTSDFENPVHQGSSIEMRGSNVAEWRISNMRWYSTQEDHCNSWADYHVAGTCRLGGTEVPLWRVVVSVNTIPRVFGAFAFPTTFWAGQIDVTPVYDSVEDCWIATVAIGTFRRDVRGTAVVNMPTSSQFYAMLLAEENFHVGQLEGTTSTLLSDLWKPEDVMALLQTNQSFRGETAFEAECAALTAWIDARRDIQNRDLEKLAEGTILRYQVEAEAKAAAGVTHRYSLICTYGESNVP